MPRQTFRQFVEADIFGFDKELRTRDEPDDNLLSRPINTFSVELLIHLLSQKKVAGNEGVSHFMNEVRWGTQPGAIKVEVDTGYTVYIKKLGMDRQGNPRWIAKRMWQINRQGYGGLEDAVVQELFDQVQKYAETGIDSPKPDYKPEELENLVQHVYNKIKRTSKAIFIPEGIRRLSEHVYIIQLGVRGHGLEAMSQQRVEQNQTMISYDPHAGTIRVTNYNLESPTGGPHEWRINPSDLDLIFFPSQDRDEISETIAVHLRYY